jgi:hypothetical protein
MCFFKVHFSAILISATNGLPELKSSYDIGFG